MGNYLHKVTRVLGYYSWKSEKYEMQQIYTEKIQKQQAFTINFHFCHFINKQMLPNILLLHLKQVHQFLKRLRFFNHFISVRSPKFTHSNVFYYLNTEEKLSAR